MEMYSGDQLIHLTASVMQNLLRIMVVNLSNEKIPRLTINVLYSEDVVITPSVLQTALAPGEIYRDCLIVHACDHSFGGVLQAEWLDGDHDIRVVTCPIVISPCGLGSVDEIALWTAIQTELPRYEIDIRSWAQNSAHEFIRAFGQSCGMVFRAVSCSDHLYFGSLNPVLLLEYRFLKVILWTCFKPSSHPSWQSYWDQMLAHVIPTNSSLFFEIGRMFTTLFDCVELNMESSSIQTKYEKLRHRLQVAQIMILPPWRFSGPLTDHDRMNLTQLLTQIETSILS